MICSEVNWEDVRKYYEGTFVKFKETGDVIWQIASVEPQRMLIRDSKGEECGVHLTKEYNLDYVMPSKATYQWGDHAVQLSRIPARQWKKGMCKANTSFARLEGDGSWDSMGFDITIIEAFVNKPAYYDPELALQEFQRANPLMSVALTPRFSMARNGKVFLDKVFVAKVEFGEGAVLTRRLLQPEITKLFPKLKLKVIN